MHDADAGRHHLEGVECLHAPFHEFVALVVALEFHLHVEPQRIRTVEVIDLHRMVNHQIHRHQRLDDLRVFAHLRGSIAHRGEVGQQRHAGEILQHDARHHKGNFLGARCVRLPVRQLADVRLAHLLVVVIAQHRFQHDADRNRQPRDFSYACRFQRGQRIQRTNIAIGEIKSPASVEKIM